ncbi:hypothetical protein JHK84_035574 [Glycine max]|nr:hypothetical protein JHK84_035574 [Glycine max]
MQHYLDVKILDLDGCLSKSVHEFFEGLIVCLLQTDQGSRGHAVRPAGGVLHTEPFNKGFGLWNLCSLQGFGLWKSWSLLGLFGVLTLQSVWGAQSCSQGLILSKVIQIASCPLNA